MTLRRPQKRRYPNGHKDHPGRTGNPPHMTHCGSKRHCDLDVKWVSGGQSVVRSSIWPRERNLTPAANMPARCIC
jgi:hypothetical protein